MKNDLIGKPLINLANKFCFQLKIIFSSIKIWSEDIKNNQKNIQNDILMLKSEMLVF